MYSGNAPVSSFRWVQDKNQEQNPYIRLALEQADEYDVEAVYFRLFADNRPPIPQIYVYDYTTQSLNQQAQTDIAQKQRRIWSSCQVPLLYVITKTNVQIFNTYQKPEFDAKANVKYSTYQIIDFLKLANEVDEQIRLRDFSARSFDNGSFWEKNNYREDFSASKGAYESLITELRRMRHEVLRVGLERNIAHRLLVTSILIKYLEEREDEEGRTVFPKANEQRRAVDTKEYVNYKDNFFARYAEDAKGFIDVLRDGDLVRLYRDLSMHFNGKVFRLTEEEERQINQSSDSLARFADFLEGKTQGQQLTLWRMYSFKDLPVELISNIYEEFIEDKSGGIVYTPPFLVNFLLDEVLPLTDPATDVKILDPACGSGIFLVQAYKRLIYRWRSANDWKLPDLNTLKNLLRNNIYGIDIKEDAVKLAIFSLTVALCDELSPLEIWNDLKFDDLDGNNLQADDFFKLVQHASIDDNFDLLVGNPPFNGWTSSADEIESKRVSEGDVKVPDKQPALLFLDQAIKLTKRGANLCLILPSGPFLYNLGSFAFRKQFLERYNLRYITDFTHLSRFLFGKADHPTLAVFVRNEAPTKEDILHAIIRRTRIAKAKVWFELDQYDFHWVPYDVALSKKETDKVTWKSNFIGGGRINLLISRLASINRKLGDYLNKRKNVKEVSKSWFYGEGFIMNDKYSNLEADFLLHKTYIPTNALTEFGIDESKLQKVSKKTVGSRRAPQLYEAPLILLKERISKSGLIVSYREENSYFTNDIVGISAPSSDQEHLKDIYNFLNKGKLSLLFFIAGYSGRFLVSKSSSILKRDIDALPFPEDNRLLDLSSSERILVEDTLKYFLPFRREHAKLTEIEKLPTNNQLEEFGKVYLQVLNSVYEDYQSGQWLETSSHIIYPFYWGQAPQLPHDSAEIEDYLDSLLEYEQPSGSLRFKRVMRIYNENVIYLIKPKQLRYWLRSIALRDADETFASLVKQEYELSPA